jgi:TusA-related sulfurtransferase
MGIFSIFRASKHKQAKNQTELVNEKSSKATSLSGNPVLDCSAVHCPMPIVMIAKRFEQMNSGDELEVLASDKAFRSDLEAWLRKTGNILVSFSDEALKRAIIKKN